MHELFKEQVYIYVVAAITKLSLEVEYLLYFLEFQQTLKKVLSNKLAQATTYVTENGNSATI